MPPIETDEQLDEALTRPSDRDRAAVERLRGDILLLGAGGKMGPTLAKRVRRASNKPNVIAVSRFQSEAARQELETAGIETLSCDLLDQASVARLPRVENVLFLAG